MPGQFLVPQFIDVEPKIIGPITVRQFIIMIVGFILIFIEYKTLTFWVFIFSAVLTFGVFGTIAFLKINGRPFHFFLLNVVETLKRPRLAVWDKTMTTAEVKQFIAVKPSEEKKEIIPRKRLVASSHLEELSLLVNTGGAYQPTELDLKYEESKKQKQKNTN